ncbi:DUF2730 family protein [Photobacterium sanguinicancri]|jgi:DNA-binding GntR family transcriptional regulator|uniref:DUF2730 domain-containing protein n=1 Tax=Photobacterium sanguinicancri TaxID=875932 RepID=A0ABX4FSV6_9GAMM|nr:DUF2730 family protein [Photobacterium sanguinicancri]OZS41968.1 hypothetical protein ASV53_20945 [Photobacterium sanguinicancri]
MDGELIKTWWPIVVVAGGLAGAGVFAWLSNRFATKAEQKKLEERVADVEKAIAAAPSKDDWHETDRRLVKVSTQNEAILNSISNIENRLAMLYENEFRKEQK